MRVQLVRRLVNVSEYNRMLEVGILTEDDNVELIRGEIVEMSPIGSRHAACVNRIANLLPSMLFGKVIISTQNPVVLDDLSEPEPDIAILKMTEDYYDSQNPRPNDVLCLIEVADTTILQDREIKIPLYAEAGIPECWLIDLEKDSIEVYKNPSQGVYKNREIKLKGDNIYLAYLDITIQVSSIIK